jgi:hypothetical protein
MRCIRDHWVVCCSLLLKNNMGVSTIEPASSHRAFEIKSGFNAPSPPLTIIVPAVTTVRLAVACDVASPGLRLLP